MPYVERDENGKIKGLYVQPQEGYAEELLSEDHLEVAEYLTPPTTLAQTLSEIFDAQPVELRARFAPLRAAIRLELELGHVDVACEIINQAEVPSELEALRQQMLAVFPSAEA